MTHGSQPVDDAGTASMYWRTCRPRGLKELPQTVANVVAEANVKAAEPPSAGPSQEPS